MESDRAKGLLDGERSRLEGVRHAFDSDHLRDESEDDSMSDLSHVHQHEADIGSETFEREKDISILEQVEAELADVDRALARIDSGRYGSCDACGDAIPDERLEVVPAARFCTTCQDRAEHSR